MSAATEPFKTARARTSPTGPAVDRPPPTGPKRATMPPFAVDDNLPTELRFGRRRPLAPGWRFLRSSGIILSVDIVVIFTGVLLVDRLDEARIAYLVLVPVWLALLGSYRPRIAPSVQADLVPLLGALACPMLVLACIRTPSAVSLLHDVPVVTGLILAGRVFSYFLRRMARVRTASAEPTLIVGAGVLGCEVARVLLDHPVYGMMPVGFIDGSLTTRICPCRSSATSTSRPGRSRGWCGTRHRRLWCQPGDGTGRRAPGFRRSAC